MTLFKMDGDSFEEIPPTTFKTEGIYERSDLQRLLRDQFQVIDPDVMIIAEEFSTWQDSARRSPTRSPFRRARAARHHSPRR